jgi:hypothetical protein
VAGNEAPGLWLRRSITIKARAAPIDARFPEKTLASVRDTFCRDRCGIPPNNPLIRALKTKRRGIYDKAIDSKKIGKSITGFYVLSIAGQGPAAINLFSSSLTARTRPVIADYRRYHQGKAPRKEFCNDELK